MRSGKHILMLFGIVGMLLLLACSEESSSAPDEEELSSSSSDIESSESKKTGESSSSFAESSESKEKSSCSSAEVSSSSAISSSSQKVKIITNIEGGFYSSAVTLVPPEIPSGHVLRCLQNGSIPTAESSEFSEPLTIDQNVSLRCVAFKKNVAVDTLTKTFFIAEKVDMPIVSISVDSAFFKEHYVKTDCDAPSDCQDSMALFQKKEYPVHVEYFEKGSSSNVATWGIDAGIDLVGDNDRLYDKKSVVVTLRDKYQAGWLNYGLFETRKAQSHMFKSFILSNNGERFVSDYFEDALAGAILEGSGVDYQRSRQVVVFYNGEYYGIHDMRENYDGYYVEDNYGISAYSVDMVEHVGGIDRIKADAGSTSEYVAMLNFIGSNSFEGENNKNYSTVKTMMDIGNFADYMAAEIFYKNGDWPNNNVRVWRSPDHPWKFMVYDLDHGFGWKWGVNNGEFDDNTNMFEWIEKGGGNKPCKKEGCFANLYNQLIQNPEFLRVFLHRSAAMWKNYLNSNRISSVVNSMVATIPESEYKRDTEKFLQKEMYYPQGFDYEGDIFKSWASERDNSVVSEYKKQFGLEDLVSVKIKSEGSGYVLMEGMVLPSKSDKNTDYSGKFFSGLPMLLEAVPANGAVFAGWSDGETSPTRLVTVEDGVAFTANFK